MVSVHGKSLIKKVLNTEYYTKPVNKITTVKLIIWTVLKQAINIDNHPQTNSATQAT